MGMDAGSSEHKAPIVVCESSGQGRRQQRLTDADDRLRARIAGAGNYLVAVAVERRVREVGVAVDEDVRVPVLRGHLRSIQRSIGAATYIELKVPVTIPKDMTQAKGRMTSPAKSSNASVAAKVVTWVITERGRVSLIDRLSVS